MLHLLGHGDAVQHGQPHHGLRLQVGPLQELGRLDGRLAVALGRGGTGGEAQSRTQLPRDTRSSPPARPHGGASPGHRGTHESEAAADAGLHIAAPEGRHLPQLARDLDGLMEQDTQVPLVAQAPGVRHLAEEVCGGTDRETAPSDTRLVPGHSRQHGGAA